MARTEARIFTTIWRDEDFRALPVGEQWLYFALLSQPDLSPCGVLPDLPNRWATLAQETTARQVTQWRLGLAGRRFVVLDPESGEVWIRALVRLDGGLRSPNLTVAIARSFGAVHSEVIREGIIDELHREFPQGILEGLGERFDKPNRQKEQKVIADRLPGDFRDAVTCAITTSPNHHVTRSLAVLPSSNTYAREMAVR